MTFAQSDPLKIVTVTRPPFSMVENGKETGFSLDLWAAVAKELNVSYEITRVDGFADMLMAVETGAADGAIANISITSAREGVMDFTQPIYESGLQIMVPDDGRGTSVLSILLRRDLLLAIVGAFALLFGGGMIMWALERKHQDYFNHSASDAMFPSFWWALNLVVNGGFEQLAPRSFLGRIFGTLMVVSSLFIVSIFVAKITATLTVDAIQNNVGGINDLYDKRVGTIENSTAANYMDKRDLRFTTYTGLDDLIANFENGELDAVVFDAPILGYYVNTRGKGDAEMVGSVFLSENYGMALQSGSDLAEPINRALLTLRETGKYDALLTKWFGNSR
ncbi:MAG: transporter substrate-binding domain-containing protein [Planktomarina sp.]